MSDSGKDCQKLDEKKNPSGFFNSYMVTTLQYNPELCINCKRCTQVCPHGVFMEGPDHAELARPAACMECGACARNCPVQALTVSPGVGCAAALLAAWTNRLLRRKVVGGCC